MTSEMIMYLSLAFLVGFATGAVVILTMYISDQESKNV